MYSNNFNTRGARVNEILQIVYLSWYHRKNMEGMGYYAVFG